ncbi:MAG: Ig-like domain repeat protein [Treponema sp.]|nr:Ig-like domain repeat protein [Treponema sp.]
MKKFLFSAGFGIAVVLWAIITSCEVGLGPAVDTEAPTLSISYPPTSAVIRDSFVVGGTVRDDKSVDCVEVSVFRVAQDKSKTLVQKKLATVEGESWYTELNTYTASAAPNNTNTKQNPDGWELSDGTYEISVTAYDNADHNSGALARTVEIDNTAPVLLLNTPLTVGTADPWQPASYGRVIKIAGDFYDAHGVGLRFYTRQIQQSGSWDAIKTAVSESVLGEQSVYDVSDVTNMSQTTPLVIGQYFTADQIAASTDDITKNARTAYTAAYEKIYGTVDHKKPEDGTNETRFFYGGIIMYDNAQEYKNRSAIPSSTVGNESTCYYINTTELSAFLKSYGTGGLKAKDISDMFSGTTTLDTPTVYAELEKSQNKINFAYPEPAESAGRSIVGERQGPTVGTDGLVVQINPDNYPAWQINGYVVDAGTFNKYISGNALTLRVTPNADGDRILSKKITLSYYEVEPDSVGGFKKVAGSEQIVLDPAVTDTNDDRAWVIAPTTEETSRIFRLNGLDAGKRYLFVLEGEDEDGNPYVPADGKLYGMEGATSGIPPTIRFDTEPRAYITAERLASGYTIQGRILSEDGIFEAARWNEVIFPKITVSEVDEDGNLSAVTGSVKDMFDAQTVTAHVTAATAQSDTWEWEMAVTLPDAAPQLAGAVYHYSCEIEGQSRECVKNTATFEFYVDAAAPTFTVNNATALAAKLITEADTNYSPKNGTYSIQGEWKDKGAGTKTLWYSTDSTDKKTGTWQQLKANEAPQAQEANWSFMLPVSEGSDKTLALYAVDKAGNETAVTSFTGLTFDAAPPTVTLTTATNDDPAVTEPTVQAYYNKTASEDIVFEITAEDTHELKTFNVTAFRDDAEVAPNSNGYTLTFVPPTTPGSTSQKARVTLKRDGSSDGAWKIVASATDAAGRATVTPLTIATVIDTVAPIFEDVASGVSISIQTNKTVADYFRDTALKVSGVTAEATSGLSAVYYWVHYPGRTDAGNTTLTVPTDLSQGDADGMFSFQARTGDLSKHQFDFTGTPMQFAACDGDTHNMLYVQAVDKAGNKSAIASYQIHVDQAAPLFAAHFYTHDDVSYHEAAGTVVSNGTETMTLYGTISDTGSGIGESAVAFAVESQPIFPDSSEVLYSTDPINSGNYSSSAEFTTWIAAHGASFKKWSELLADRTEASDAEKREALSRAITAWKVAVRLTAGGAVRATPHDRAGNGNMQQLFTYVVDKTAPTVRLTTPQTRLVRQKTSLNSSEESVSDATAVAAVNGSVTFSGTTEDNYTVNSVKAYYGTSPNPRLESSDVPVPGAEWTGTRTYSWSFQFAVSKVASDRYVFFDGAEYKGVPKDLYIKIVATDTANNSTVAVYKYSVDPDADRPVLMLTDTTLNKNFATLQTNTLYGMITDDDSALSGSGSVVQSFEYNIRYTSETPVRETGWKQATLDGALWSIPVEDGEVEVYFKIRDNVGTQFESKHLQYLAPKIGKDALPGDDTFLKLNVDKERPEIVSVRYDAYDAEGTPAAWSGSWSDLATAHLGGRYKRFKIRVTARDRNGIFSVTGLLGGTQSISFTAIGSMKSVDPLSGGITETWESEEIPVDTGMNTNNLICGITVKDNSTGKLDSYMDVRLTVDNKAPEIDFNTPSSQIFSAENISGQVADTYSQVTALYYAVSRTKNSQPEDWEVKEAGKQSTAWKEIQGIPQRWRISFDGSVHTNTNVVMYDELLTDYISILGIATKDDIANARYTDITTLYIWIKATDKCGNTIADFLAVNVDPQGDRPNVTLSYPDSGDTLGGEIRLIGTATDNERADYVWVQLWRGTGLEFTKAAQDYLLINGYTLGNMTDPSASVLSSDPKNNAIKVNVSGSSWHLNINSNSEFDPTGGAEKESLHMRIYATDNNKNISLPLDNVIFVDADTPRITNVWLKQFANNAAGTGDVTAQRIYTEGMAVKGEWWLTGDITDNSGIQNITWQKNGTPQDGITVSGSENQYFVKKAKTGSSTGYDYEIRIKVGSGTADSLGTDTVTIRAEEAKAGTPLYVESAFTIVYDNMKPVVIDETDLFGRYRISTDIMNTNGFYTFGSAAMEDSAPDDTAQTGIERVVIFFTRDSAYINGNTGYRCLYDPYLKKGADYNEIKYYRTTAGLNFGEGLWWRPITVTSVSGTSLTLQAMHPNVHTGGLALVNGTIHRIESVIGNVVTLEDDPGATTTALFAVGAVVVDNTIAEGLGTVSDGAGYYSGGTYDDGDNMMESLIRQGTTWNWEVNINSQNISDGEITLHYVVYDKAGNYTEKTVAGFIKNYQPRIAGVIVGTDGNGDDTVSADEFVSMSGIYAGGYDLAGRKVTEVTFPVQTSSSTYRSAINAKGLTVVKPEILGGNGALGYTMAVSKWNGSAWEAAPYYTNTTVRKFNKNGGEESDAVISGLEMKLSLVDFLSAGTNGAKIVDGAGQRFSFTIWDSTPGSTIGNAASGSQSATLNVIMDVNVMGAHAGSGSVIPFYWKSETDNSLFGESRENGHIELPSDFPGASGTSGINDGDAKVSGKIKFEGISYTDGLLEKIQVQLGNLTLTATYSRGAWTYSSLLGQDGSLPSGGGAIAITQATFEEALRAGAITAIPDDRAPTDMVPYTSQAYGHIVHCTAYIDTEKVANTVTQADVNSAYRTYVRGAPTLSGTSVTYGTPSSHTVSGKVDVVPYITEVVTALSELDAETPSVYARTALGHYPVREGEKITIKGLNLGTMTKVLIQQAGVTKQELASSAITNRTSTGFDVTVPTGCPSGTVVLQNAESTISTLNHLNRNPVRNALGAVTQAGYNSQANGTNNDLLDDDVVIDVWQFQTVGTARDGLIKYPEMQIGPSGQVGFAYADGNFNFQMAGFDPAGGSYQSHRPFESSWGPYNESAFAFAPDGRTYGLSTNEDVGLNGSAFTTFFINRCVTTDNALTVNGNYHGGLWRRRLFSTTTTVSDTSSDTVIDRTVSPSLVTTMPDGTGGVTYVYLAYYDKLKKEVRYHWGSIGQPNKIEVAVDTIGKRTASGNQLDRFRVVKNNHPFQVGDLVSITRSDSDGYNQLDRSTYYRVSEVSANDFMIIPASGESAVNALSTDKNWRVSAVGGQLIDIRGGKSTQDQYGAQDMLAQNYCVVQDNMPNSSVAVGAIPKGTGGAADDIAYVLYGNSRGLYIKYSTSPRAQDIAWVTKRLDDRGSDIRTVVDTDGIIHIAYSKDANLMYAHMKYTDSGITPQVIDSYQLTGTQITLDVAKNAAGQVVPYIGYFSQSIQMPKLAYAVAFDGTLPAGNGSDGQKLTQRWEVSVVPESADYQARNDTVCVGVHKQNGVIQAIPVVSNSPNITTFNGGAIVSNNMNTALVGGNGSLNPVIAYSTENSILQMAQKN